MKKFGLLDDGFFLGGIGLLAFFCLGASALARQMVPEVMRRFRFLRPLNRREGPIEEPCDCGECHHDFDTFQHGCLDPHGNEEKKRPNDAENTKNTELSVFHNFILFLPLLAAVVHLDGDGPQLRFSFGP